MQRIHRYLGSLLLGAALIAPMAVTASSQERNEEKREEKREHERRYYDRDHKDYHDWDDREDAAYRRWLAEKHYQTHREFSKLKHREQSEYWEWRHAHRDNDGDRH